MKCLSEKRSGCTRKEISEKCEIEANGKLTKILDVLVNFGFVKASSFYGKKRKKLCMNQLIIILISTSVS